MISFDFSTKIFRTIAYSWKNSRIAYFQRIWSLDFFQLGVKIGYFWIHFPIKTKKKALYSDNFDMVHLYPLITEVILVKWSKTNHTISLLWLPQHIYNSCFRTHHRFPIKIELNLLTIFIIKMFLSSNFVEYIKKQVARYTLVYMLNQFTNLWIFVCLSQFLF